MAKEWYVEETYNGWHLNEYSPDGSDGWLATFGRAQEAEARQAAHEHNTHADLVAALEATLPRFIELMNYRTLREGQAWASDFREVEALIRAALAKTKGEAT